MTDEPDAATRAEVASWFFDDYVPCWVAVAAGTSLERPEFVLDYWGTPMHVTALDLVVAGDVVYNGVHRMLLETGTTGFQSWLTALDVVEALKPHSVVAGQNPDLTDDPATIDQTRRYLLDAQRVLAKSPTPQEFFDEITTRYPDRLNVGPVWYGAHGLLGVELPS